MADAERNCIRLGGNLASIHSYWENLVVRRMIKRACRSYVWAWIGLTDAIQERRWMWTDGSRVVFRRWARTEPNNRWGREDCTNINFGGRYWNDLNCRSRLPSVCVRRR
ncbi:ladderlectin-like [Pagrus major]|uniref:ladderlectin-like n=1 Tax=Pagrus major TaxID=143350 RepID=UPI003CC8A53A